MAEKEARVGKKGPVGSSGDVEDSPELSGLTVTPITNRGVPGGRELTDLVGAEKVSAPWKK